VFRSKFRGPARKQAGSSALWSWTHGVRKARASPGRRWVTLGASPTRPAECLACVEECRFPRASRGDRLESEVAAEQICSRLGSSELSQIFPNSLKT
jgi:hypothetical protein